MQTGLFQDPMYAAQALTDHSDMARQMESERDLEIARRALAELPPFERDLLIEYLGDEAPSERTLATRHSVSRYRVREILISGLGRIVTRLHAQLTRSTLDGDIARSLWLENRTLPEAAALLGITEQQARLSQFRNIDAIRRMIDNLKGFQKVQVGRTAMKRSIGNDAIGVFKKAVLSRDRSLLPQIRENAAEIISALDDDSSNDFDLPLHEIDPEWLADVYASLSPGTEALGEDAAAVRSLITATEQDERSVGCAFRYALMVQLPTTLTDFGSWFGKIPPIQDFDKQNFLLSPAVQAGSPYTEQLCTWGITPITIFYATEAIAMLVERLLDYEELARSRPILLVTAALQNEDLQFIQPEMAIREIQEVAECPQLSAECLLTWSIEVGGYRPFLFDGINAKPHPLGLELHWTDKRRQNLYQRWGLTRAIGAGG
jgi:hypothetical protein